MARPILQSSQDSNEMKIQESISQYYHQSEEKYSTDVVRIERNLCSISEMKNLIVEPSRRILHVIAENEKEKTGRRDEEMAKLKEKYGESLEQLYKWIDDTVKRIESSSEEERLIEIADLKEERDQLTRELNGLKDQCQLHELEIVKLKAEVGKLKKENHATSISLDQTKRHLQLRKEEVERYRVFNFKTKDNIHYVTIQNMLNVLVKLQENMETKLAQMQKEVQNKHQEMLTSIETKIRNENRETMSRQITKCEKKLSKHTEMRQQQIEALKRSHEEEKSVLNKRIEEYEAILTSMETDALDTRYDENDSSESTVDTRQYSNSSVNFVFSSILNSARVLEFTQLLEICVKALEQQAEVRDHELPPEMFRQTCEKATSLFPDVWTSTVLKEYGMGREDIRISTSGRSLSFSSAVNTDTPKEEEEKEKAKLEEDDYIQQQMC